MKFSMSIFFFIFLHNRSFLETVYENVKNGHREFDHSGTLNAVNCFFFSKIKLKKKQIQAQLF